MNHKITHCRPVRSERIFFSILLQRDPACR